MGNQARVAPNSTVVSTSTRNFPNRLGDGANVYLASSELAAVASALGKIPNMEEYMSYMGEVKTMSENIYRYLNFNEIKSYMEAADRAKEIPVTNVAVTA
jgi:aconitate hydratase 2/2-methylisocitrate dehydratase